MDEINWGVLLPLIITNLILVVIALIDCIKAESTKGPKWLWVIIIIFINLLGPILYFVIGRRND